MVLTLIVNYFSVIIIKVVGQEFTGTSYLLSGSYTIGNPQMIQTNQQLMKICFASSSFLETNWNSLLNRKYILEVNIAFIYVIHLRKNLAACKEQMNSYS